MSKQLDRFVAEATLGIDLDAVDVRGAIDGVVELGSKEGGTRAAALGRGIDDGPDDAVRARGQAAGRYRDRGRITPRASAQRGPTGALRL